MIQTNLGKRGVDFMWLITGLTFNVLSFLMTYSFDLWTLLACVAQVLLEGFWEMLNAKMDRGEIWQHFFLEFTKVAF